MAKKQIMDGEQIVARIGLILEEAGKNNGWVNLSEDDIEALITAREYINVINEKRDQEEVIKNRSLFDILGL